MGSVQRLVVESGGRRAEVSARPVALDPRQLFRFDESDEEQACLDLLTDHLLGFPPPIALVRGVEPRLLEYFFDLVPELKARVRCVLAEGAAPGATFRELPVFPLEGAPDEPFGAVFLCELDPARWGSLVGRTPAGAEVVTPAVLERLDATAVPQRAWVTQNGAPPTGPVFSMGGRAFEAVDGRRDLVTAPGARFWPADASPPQAAPAPERRTEGLAARAVRLFGGLRRRD